MAIFPAASRREAGTLYSFRLDGGPKKLLPDPASRFQPKGVHGPSQVDRSPLLFKWKHDAACAGALRWGQVHL